jgi:hypothetical protein
LQQARAKTSTAMTGTTLRIAAFVLMMRLILEGQLRMFVLTRENWPKQKQYETKRD